VYQPPYDPSFSFFIHFFANNGYEPRRSWDVYVLNEEGVLVAAGTRDEQRHNLVIVTIGEVAGIVKVKNDPYRTSKREV